MKQNFIYIFLISSLMVSALNAFQISFTRQDVGFHGSSYGAVEFGDYDADGDLDLLVIGQETGTSRVGLVYINKGGIFNPDVSVTLPFDFATGDAKWGDYDNDGDLDILISGQSGGRVTAILRNDAGSFTDQEYNLQNLQDSAVEWGDIDNDGDLDVVVSGFNSSFDRVLDIYLNMGDDFIKDTTFAGVQVGDIELLDFDKDGDLDLFMTGLLETQSSPIRSSRLMRNDNGTFSDSGIQFVPMLEPSSDFGDYDGDGDLDLLLSGNGNDGSLEARTLIYRNDSTDFSRQSFTITHLDQSDVKWADFDNDGDLDFVQSGRMISGDYVMEVYENTGSGFTKTEQVFQDSLASSAISVGDYDNDGDVDFAVAGWKNDGHRFTILYSNNAANTNTKPIRPQNSGSLASGDGSTVELYWGPGSDNETQATGLTYNIRIGTTEGGDEILSPHLTEDGKYMLSRRGNMESRMSYLVNGLPSGTYYWGVQSVDNNFAVSDFLQRSFTISLEPSIEITKPMATENLVGGEPYTISWNSNDVQSIKIEFSSNNGISWISVTDSIPASNGQYIWNVPEIQTIVGKIRLSAVGNSEISTISPTFNVISRFVIITYPNGSETFKADSSIFIDWLSPYTSDFRLEYSTDNGSNWTEITVIYETFGESSDEWTIPDTPSQQCLVRVTDINHPTVQDVSNEAFTISNEGLKYINIISPNGGERWEAGSFKSVFWEHTGVVNIKVEVSYDNGMEDSYITLASSVPANDGAYSWQLPNMVAPSCYVRLSAVENPDVMDISDQGFAITDTTGPVFDNSNGTIDFTSPVEVGHMDTVRVKVTDNTGLAEVILYYKTAGTFENFQMGQMNKNIDKYYFHLNAAPATGFQLYVEAMDIHENKTITDTVGIQIKIDDTFENQNENVGGSDVQDYILFSVPVELEDKSPAAFLINNNFDDTPDPQDYRFYSFQNGSSNNFIEYNGSGFGQIIPGKGYFIISNDDFNMVAGNGKTVDPGSAFIIQGLEQGWNLIGSPFIYPVPFANVTAENPVSGVKVNFNLWEFNNGSWQKVQTGELLPWRGYALDLEASAVFKIPPYRETLAKTSPTFTTLNNNNDEWMIQIKAQNGSNKSDFNFAGQLFNATNALDNYDLNGPPRIENQLTISFKNDNNENKVTDIRQSNDKGQSWDFICHLDPDKENLSLHFSGIDEFSADRDYFLIDNQSGIPYNLKLKNEIEFATKGISEKSFQLLVGTREYLENLNIGAELYPSDFSLKQNFPNPFNPSTQISFTIKKTGRVRLAVYDLLGQEVKLLVNDVLQPGYYNSVWDASGQSSGIYFIKLSSGSFVDIKRAVFIK